MTGTYDDGTIVCGPDGLEIHHYYFPFGTKSVPYGEVKAVRRVDIGALSGQWRIWGTANYRYWANLDPRRPKKKVGFIIDSGHTVSPVVTPDDPDGFEATIRERASLGPGPATTRGPFI